MKQLFVEDDQELIQQAIEQERAWRDELAGISEELELFRYPIWLPLKARLERYIRDDMNLLVGCSMDEVASARARIKAHRHLLGLEQELELREAELRSLIDRDPEEEDDDD